MEFTNHDTRRPKTKRAAIRQAAQLLLIQEGKKKKGANVMKRLEEINQKIQKLELEKQTLEENLKKGQIDLEGYEEQIRILENEWEFTQTEILEERLRILQRQLRETEALKRAGILQKPSSFGETSNPDLKPTKFF